MSNQNVEDPSDDLWDDTEIRAHWDGAVAEFKKYHSMAARGEKVPIEEVTVPQTKLEVIKDPPQSPTETLSGDSDLNDAQNPEVDGDHQSAGTSDEGVAEENVVHEQAMPTASSVGMAMPAVLLDGGNNNNNNKKEMKNVMMAWYYAGYYTGLFEGKQQALADLQNDQ